jgi:predicted nucleic acid-binding Zn ribbon protein
MCLNCNYPYADESGFCSEYCELEFEAAQQEAKLEEEDQLAELPCLRN